MQIVEYKQKLKEIKSEKFVAEYQKQQDPFSSPRTNRYRIEAEPQGSVQARMLFLIAYNYANNNEDEFRQNATQFWKNFLDMVMTNLERLK